MEEGRKNLLPAEVHFALLISILKNYLSHPLEKLAEAPNCFEKM